MILAVACPGSLTSSRHFLSSASVRQPASAFLSRRPVGDVCSFCVGGLLGMCAPSVFGRRGYERKERRRRRQQLIRELNGDKPSGGKESLEPRNVGREESRKVSPRIAEKPSPASPASPNPPNKSHFTQDLNVVSQANSCNTTDYSRSLRARTSTIEARGLGSRGEPQKYIAGTWLAEGRSIGLD